MFFRAAQARGLAAVSFLVQLGDFSMKRFEFSVSFRLNGIVCSRKYTTHTKDIGIARAWIYATTAIDGLDVIEIIDLNK
jgi:hypothetical protein